MHQSQTTDLNVAGKLVDTLVSGEQKPGHYNLTWNRPDTKGSSCACGVYFCTLAAENQHFSRKVTLTVWTKRFPMQGLPA
jgi:hypothetical protein